MEVGTNSGQPFRRQQGGSVDLPAALVATKPAGPSQNRAAQAVVSQWAAIDPPAATAWVMRFPKGETRDHALQQVAGRWASSDPSAAGQWLSTFPADKARDALVQSYIGSTTYEYPELASVWAETISDANQRIRTVENIVRNWLQSDRVSAEKWINQSSLPDDKKQSLLKLP